MAAALQVACTAVATALAVAYFFHRQRRVVLITGASGYLGNHVLQALKHGWWRYSLHGTFNGNQGFLDAWSSVCICHKIPMSDGNAIRALVDRIKPDVVLHLAAISSPAKAEADPEHAKAVNCPVALLESLPASAGIIFLSTDQVYDGTRAPYSETDAAKPVNVYGKSKLDFEEELQKRMPTRSLALRMSLLLGPTAPKATKRNSFLQDCNRMIASGKPNTFFSNEYRSVVHVDDVLAVLRWAIAGGVTAAPGCYNMGGPESLSRDQIARAVAQHQGLSSEGILASPRPRPGPGEVRSPPDITMDSSKLERASGLTFRPLSKMLHTAF